MTTDRNQVLPSRIRPVGTPPPPPAPPRPFDVYAAVELLAELDAAGATIRVTGEVAVSSTPLRLGVEAAVAAGELWGQCLGLVSQLHEARRWQRHRGVPDTVVMTAALAKVSAIVDEIGEPAGAWLSMWLDGRWTSPRRCPFEWCGGRDGAHESAGRKGAWHP